jgi:hypothetical protein
MSTLEALPAFMASQHFWMAHIYRKLHERLYRKLHERSLPPARLAAPPVRVFRQSVHARYAPPSPSGDTHRRNG